MMRSLFSGVAGLKTHQTKMDVIGNNIANVNTVAYKSQSVTFQELMYQTTQSASGANEDTGRAGVNAKQIGLGVTTGAINASITTAGASQTTGNPFDIQIKGDSFFVVSDGSNNYFTRAGAFYVDGAGNLAMTSNGYTVMGWQEDSTNPGTIKKDTVSALKIMSPENMTSEPEQTTQAYLSGVIDKNSTQLNTADGLVVNISLYDSLGYSYIAKFGIKEGANEGEYELTPLDLIDSNGFSLMHKSDEAGYEKIGWDKGGYSEAAMLSLDNTTLTYDKTTGKNLNRTDPADPNSEEVPLVLTLGGSVANTFPSTVEIAVGTSTMYDNKGTSTIKGTAGNYDSNYAGRKVGAMSGVAISTDGKITATYDNGTRKLLGQIAIANFANPSGLEKAGENLYQETMNSGSFDGIGEDITSGGGSMSTGVLEMSNVDLSAEFTDMITTQRGFQANSRIITVSDSMLEELTNLKR